MNNSSRPNSNISSSDTRGDTGYEEKRSLNINIGAGKFELSGWVNLDMPSSWYRQQQNVPFIPFDIRKDPLPYLDNAVNLAYCGNVIEHVEYEHSYRLFQEVYRCLKKGGLFRIVCLDAEFLYTATKYYPVYWSWRMPWFLSPHRKPASPNPDPLDFLVREVATPRCRQYVHGVEPYPIEDVRKAFTTMGWEDFLNYLTHDLTFREECPGDHIHWFSFAKLQAILTAMGFTVVRSRFGGSLAPEMQNTGKFDSHPQMALHLDALKR